MKTLTEWNTPEFENLLDDESFESVDWKTNPKELLEVIDDLLEPYKLEIIVLDVNDDEVYFKIWRRES